MKPWLQFPKGIDGGTAFDNAKKTTGNGLRLVADRAHGYYAPNLGLHPPVHPIPCQSQSFVQSDLVSSNRFPTRNQLP